jgi:hypothetical protein
MGHFVAPRIGADPNSKNDISRPTGPKFCAILARNGEERNAFDISMSPDGATFEMNGQ